MSSNTTQVSARVDNQIKMMAQEILEREGLHLATAIRMFVTKTALEGGLRKKSWIDTIKPYRVEWNEWTIQVIG